MNALYASNFQTIIRFVAWLISFYGLYESALIYVDCNIWKCANRETTDQLPSFGWLQSPIKARPWRKYHIHYKFKWHFMHTRSFQSTRTIRSIPSTFVYSMLCYLELSVNVCIFCNVFFLFSAPLMFSALICVCVYLTFHFRSFIFTPAPHSKQPAFARFVPPLLFFRLLISHVRKPILPGPLSYRHIYYTENTDQNCLSLCMDIAWVCSAVSFAKGFKPLYVLERLRFHWSVMGMVTNRIGVRLIHWPCSYFYIGMASTDWKWLHDPSTIHRLSQANVPANVPTNDNTKIEKKKNCEKSPKNYCCWELVVQATLTYAFREEAPRFTCNTVSIVKRNQNCFSLSLMSFAETEYVIWQSKKASTFNTSVSCIHVGGHFEYKVKPISRKTKLVFTKKWKYTTGYIVYSIHLYTEKKNTMTPHSLQY